MEVVLSSLVCLTLTTLAFQLCDTRSIIAIWEKGQAGFGPDAQITLTHLGMTIVTEILTTLTLNLVARRLDW